MIPERKTADTASQWNWCGGNPTATLTDQSGNIVVSYNDVLNFSLE